MIQRHDRFFFFRSLEQFTKTPAFFFALVQVVVITFKEVHQKRNTRSVCSGQAHGQPKVKETFADRVNAGSPVLGVRCGFQILRSGQAFQQAGCLLLVHAYTSGDGGRRLSRVAHSGHGFEESTLLRGDILDAVLIEGRDSIQQAQELVAYCENVIVGDEFIEHHDETWVARGHLMHCSDFRREFIKTRKQRLVFFPLEISANE